MKAEETTCDDLFKAQQLRVPPWQRRYTWGKPELEELWGDIERLIAAPGTSHFVGSIVLEKLDWNGLPREVQPFRVIDGQQRIASLNLLLIAIRDLKLSRVESEEQRRSDFNEFNSEFLANVPAKAEFERRLVLQGADMESLVRLLEGTGAGIAAADPVSNGYIFLSEKVHDFADDQLDLIVGIVRSRLEVVWITLSAADNAHRVFQTLNASGRPLRQSDLVRNYFFLLLGEEGDQFYEAHWKGMEARLQVEGLTEYFVAWTVARGKNGSTDRLFTYFQEDLRDLEAEPSEVLDYGVRLTSDSEIFLLIRKPTEERYRSFRGLQNLRKSERALLRALQDLAHWGTKPVRGLVLLLLQELKAGELSVQEVEKSLRVVLSFMARRILTGQQPNLHTSIFRQATHAVLNAGIENDQVADFLRLLFSMGTVRREWPGDAVLHQRGPTTPLYTASRAHWSNYILEVINRMLYANPDDAPVPLDAADWTVEHIMPQELTDIWRADLRDAGDENPDEVHFTHLHLLGNLTLTKTNSSLGTLPYLRADPELCKRKKLIGTHLPINGELEAIDDWCATAIVERGRALTTLACAGFIRPLTRDEVVSSPLRSFLTDQQQRELQEDIGSDEDDEDDEEDGGHLG